MLPPLVLTTFLFFQILYNFQNFDKKQESCWPPHFNHFFTTPKSPKFTTIKFPCFVEPTFSLQRCRKNQFWHSHAAWESLFFVLRTQRGSSIFTLDDTSPARRRFFSFSQKSAARSSKINKIASRSHGLDVSARKARKANRHKIFTYPPRLRSGRVFRIAQNLTNRFRNVCIPHRISTITTSAPICVLHKFHQHSSNLLEKTKNFSDSHFALLGKHCMNIIAGKMARSSDRFQSTFSTRRSKTQRLDICMVDPDPECGVLM